MGNGYDVSIKRLILFRNIYYVAAILSQFSCIILMIVEKNYFYFSSPSVYFLFIYGAYCNKLYNKSLRNEPLLSKKSVILEVVFIIVIILFFAIHLFLFIKYSGTIPLSAYHTVLNAVIIAPITLILGSIGYLFILHSITGKSIHVNSPFVGN